MSRFEDKDNPTPIREDEELLPSPAVIIASWVIIVSILLGAGILAVKFILAPQ